MKEYYQNFCGGYYIDDERVEELIAIKGAVFEKAQKDNLFCAHEKSSGVAYDELVRLASEGIISAKRLLGILQIEGIYITQDNSVGFENILDAADWLDIPALVTAIKYDNANRQEYLDKLYTVTQKTDYAVIVEQLQIQYGIENFKMSESAKVLDKSFAIGTAKRDVCSSQHLRVLRSNVLSDKDKRAVLLSGSKELVPAVCRLPLQLFSGKIRTSDGVRAVLDRTEENAVIMRALENNDLRNRDFYRSLCISSNSDYVRDAYADFIGKVFPESNIVNIDIASLLPTDLDSTDNNVFVRNCHENEDNVYIIRLAGKIDERIVNLVKTFTTSSNRRAFAISRFGINIDLSAVLPIFVCDGKNAQLLDGSISVVKVAEIAEDEKPLVLTELMDKKQAEFYVCEITLEDSAKEILLNFSVGKISNVLDQAILSQRIDNDPIILSVETIEKFIGDKRAFGAYGFGGTHAKN